MTRGRPAADRSRIVRRRAFAPRPETPAVAGPARPETRLVLLTIPTGDVVGTGSGRRPSMVAGTPSGRTSLVRWPERGRRTGAVARRRGSRTGVGVSR